MPVQPSIENHLLTNAKWCPSPNYNNRPDKASVSLLVIHNISLPPRQFGGEYIESFFQNRLPVEDHPYFAEIADLQVSAHLLIKRSGDVIQFVSFDKRAWHAGVSCFESEANCNDFSIGIELEGCDDLPYTSDQYKTLVQVTRSLMQHYPLITPARIVGHDQIAPGRKTDPGASFDWKHYLGCLTDE